MPIPERVRNEAAAADVALRALAETGKLPDSIAPAAPAPDPAAPPAPPAAAPVAAAPPAPAPNVAPAPAPAPNVTPAPVPPATDETLLQKYNSLQGMFNRSQADLSEMRGRLEVMQRLVEKQAAAHAATVPSTPAPAPQPQRFTNDAEIKEFSPELYDFIKRTSQETFLPMLSSVQNRVAKLEGSLGTVKQTAEQASTVAGSVVADRYFARLDQLLPDWKEINDDPRLLDWLEKADTFSGVKRNVLLQQAHGEKEAERVVAIFRKFIEESGWAPAAKAGEAPPMNPVVDPASLIAPGASAPAPASTSAPEDKRIWSVKEAEAVYDDYRNKRISPEVFAKREAAMLRAYAEGRVR